VATSVPEVERLMRGMRRRSDRGADERSASAPGAAPAAERPPAGGVV